MAPAGEGSYGQLRRRFGYAAADGLLCALRCIWVSHIHADHHVGLPTLLAARTRLLGLDCEPLLVVGPRPLRRALQGYAQLEPMRFRFVEAAASAASPPPNAPPPSPEARAAVASIAQALGLSRLESVPVVHCAHAYALVLERAGGEAESGVGGGWKLVFSGDTRPCPQLVQAARGATLLIHEVGCIPQGAGRHCGVAATCAVGWGGEPLPPLARARPALGACIAPHPHPSVRLPDCNSGLCLATEGNV